MGHYKVYGLIEIFIAIFCFIMFTMLMSKKESSYLSLDTQGLISQSGQTSKFFSVFLFCFVLGLRCCARAFFSCGERGLFFVVVRGLLVVAAPLVAEHGL